MLQGDDNSTPRPDVDVGTVEAVELISSDTNTLQSENSKSKQQDGLPMQVHSKPYVPSCDEFTTEAIDIIDSDSEEFDVKPSDSVLNGSLTTTAEDKCPIASLPILSENAKCVQTPDLAIKQEMQTPKQPCNKSGAFVQFTPRASIAAFSTLGAEYSFLPVKTELNSAEISSPFHHRSTQSGNDVDLLVKSLTVKDAQTSPILFRLAMVDAALSPIFGVGLVDVGINASSNEVQLPISTERCTTACSVSSLDISASDDVNHATGSHLAVAYVLE